MPAPEIFGLHENADITCDQNETYDLFATVLSLQPRVATGAGASREDVIGAQCEAILAKLPEAFDVEAVAAAYPTRYQESMNTVLVQECIRCVTESSTRLPHVIKCLRLRAILRHGGRASPCGGPGVFILESCTSSCRHALDES